MSSSSDNNKIKTSPRDTVSRRNSVFPSGYELIDLEILQNMDDKQ